jgi:hypothetical protein
MKSKIFSRIALLALLSASFTAPSRAQLQGIVDAHAHSDPDTQPRKIDALELARQAQKEGMRAIVLKNHQMPTVQLAYVVSQVVPGIQIFGGIVLNRAVGGINPQAVEEAAAVKGNFLKIVWFPTVDTELGAVRDGKAARPFVPVAKNGQLLPETMDVLKLIAKNNLVLATGHSQPADSLLLVSEARKLGITRIVVTHPLPLGMSVAQMQEAAKQGAMLEFTGNPILPSGPQGNINVKPETYADAIRAVGPEHVILSGDFGGAQFPAPMDGWKAYLAALQKAGISQSDLELMSRKNPAHLLGLE